MWKMETEGLEVELQPMWRCVVRQPASFPEGQWGQRGLPSLTRSLFLQRQVCTLVSTGMHYMEVIAAAVTDLPVGLSCSVSVDYWDWRLSMAGTSATSPSASPGRVCVTTGRNLRSNLQLSNRIETDRRFQIKKNTNSMWNRIIGFQQHHVSEDAR